MILGWMLLVACGALLCGWSLGRWWPRRRQEEPVRAQPRQPLDLPHVAPPILHLLDKLSQRPVCGASLRESWTILPETVTCPECRKQGEAAMLQWYANNR